MEVTKIKTGRQKNMEAEKLIEALHTVEKLKRTMRHCYTSDDRKESVAEHCWRVALMAYWMEDEFPEVDINKVIKMCLIHDLGECFTGDIPCFKKTEADEETEENLLYQWVATLPEPLNDKMRTLYQEMSELKTLEAKIYKALDNMEGALSHNESDLKTWEPHEYELTKNYGIDKSQFHPYIKHLRECIRQETVDKIIAAGRNITLAEDVLKNRKIKVGVLLLLDFSLIIFSYFLSYIFTFAPSISVIIMLLMSNKVDYKKKALLSLFQFVPIIGDILNIWFLKINYEPIFASFALVILYFSMALERTKNIENL